MLPFRLHRLSAVQLSGRRLGNLCLTTLLSRVTARFTGAAVFAVGLYAARGFCGRFRLSRRCGG
jgi:hypothetical protein